MNCERYACRKPVFFFSWDLRRERAKERVQGAEQMLELGFRAWRVHAFLMNLHVVY